MPGTGGTGSGSRGGLVIAFSRYEGMPARGGHSLIAQDEVLLIHLMRRAGLLVRLPAGLLLRLSILPLLLLALLALALLLVTVLLGLLRVAVLGIVHR